jgi:hypothetical protein
MAAGTAQAGWHFVCHRRARAAAGAGVPAGAHFGARADCRRRHRQRSADSDAYAHSAHLGDPGHRRNGPHRSASAASDAARRRSHTNAHRSAAGGHQRAVVQQAPAAAQSASDARASLHPPIRLPRRQDRTGGRLRRRVAYGAGRALSPRAEADRASGAAAAQAGARRRAADQFVAAAGRYRRALRVHLREYNLTPKQFQAQQRGADLTESTDSAT